MHTSIVSADDRSLSQLIESASSRVIYMAPGVSEAIATSLSNQFQRLGSTAVTVVLDADAEVCRLGYGTIEALKALRAAAWRAGGQVAHHAGVRIGLLIADSQTIVFTPTPLLIEGGSDAAERPNAIVLGAPDAALAAELGLGPQGIAQQRIGLDPVDPARIEAVEQDLNRAPPAKFDLARRVRVFASHFQFVELQMIGCQVSRKRARIPSELVGLAGDDLLSRFHAHFDLVANDKIEVKTSSGVLTERRLAKQRLELERKFLIVLRGHGWVILKANRAPFDAAVEDLKTNVKAFAAGVHEALDSEIARSCDQIVEALLPAVQKNPPRSYIKTTGPNPTPEYIRRRLTDDVSRALGAAEELVAGMEVKVAFKEIAYESLTDKRFVEVARKAMPDVSFLHEEFDASAAEDRSQ